MKYKILKKEKIYQGFFELSKVHVEHDKYDGTKVTKQVEIFERGDACAIVLYEKDTDSILLVEQFRFPTTQNDSGWLIELVAGMIDKGESPITSTKREIEEEIGYNVRSIESIGVYYLSPGGTSERIHLFYSEVNSNDKTLEGGGKWDESEDIKLIKIKSSDLQQALQSGLIKDAKTALGINWFLVNKCPTKNQG